MSFSDDIAKWRKKVDKAAVGVYRGTALELFSSIVKRTPIKTGRLRGNWQIELNSPPRGLTTTSASQALSTGSRTIATASIEQPIYIINNLPYAPVIERGSSKQAPRGMVAVTIAMYKRIVDRQARKNR